MVPILRQLDRAVKQMLQQYGGQQINLIGHSAGGWISRIYLGEKPYTIHGDVLEDAGLWEAHSSVNTLICLGTPHVSQERWTRKNLDFVKMYYPGAFYLRVRYVCAAWKAVFDKPGLTRIRHPNCHIGAVKLFDGDICRQLPPDY